MDLVAVDLGNTRISCGLFRNGILVDTWHHLTDEPDTAARIIVEKADGMGVALASVVPSASAYLVKYLRDRGQSLTEVSTQSHRIISGVYETMGADRLANAVAAWKLYGKDLPVIALDFGTATTLTAVSSSGQFCGGLITLGLGRTLASLHDQAEQLPAVSLGCEEGRAPSLAFDTRSAISRGTLIAHAGIIEQWVRVGRKVLGSSAVAVATGGWSQLVASHTSVLDFVDPHLTLKGIYLIAELEADQAGQG